MDAPAAAPEDSSSSSSAARAWAGQRAPPEHRGGFGGGGVAIPPVIQPMQFDHRGRTCPPAALTPSVRIGGAPQAPVLPWIFDSQTPSVRVGEVKARAERALENNPWQERCAAPASAADDPAHARRLDQLRREGFAASECHPDVWTKRVDLTEPPSHPVTPAGSAPRWEAASGAASVSSFDAAIKPVQREVATAPAADAPPPHVSIDPDARSVAHFEAGRAKVHAAGVPLESARANAELMSDLRECFAPSLVDEPSPRPVGGSDGSVSEFSAPREERPKPRTPNSPLPPGDRSASRGEQPPTFGSVASNTKPPMTQGGGVWRQPTNAAPAAPRRWAKAQGRPVGVVTRLVVHEGKLCYEEVNAAPPTGLQAFANAPVAAQLEPRRTERGAAVVDADYAALNAQLQTVLAGLMD